ncbi:MAG: hypothetical protein ACREME_02320 [Gemmatimonadales bacterium]
MLRPPRATKLTFVESIDLLRGDLPGADLVARGLSDLESGTETVESLLVSIGRPRLLRLGLDVPPGHDRAEIRLYEKLAREDPARAHSRYNALVRRLMSFERAAECAR